MAKIELTNTMTHTQPDNLYTEITWNDNGLVPAIAQDHISGEILMMAWMNKDALAATIDKREAVYWSRSRQTLWHKGESSGHTQHIKTILLDCDGDTILLKVDQVGGIACHTGRANCFYRSLNNDTWETVSPVVKNPNDIYGTKT